MKRRTFVTSAAAASTLAIVPTVRTSAKSYERIIGSNRELRMAVIGFKGRGRALISAIAAADNASLVAVCDADKKILSDHDKDNSELFRTTDLREILKRDDIDAIASATPNHWHALVTILACRAGKHVYIEKPISHNMHESQAIVQHARKHNSIVQCGFQNRSDTGLLTFFENLHGGKYGKVLSVHGTCHRSRESIGKLATALQVPAHIDYEMWLGPAADQPIMRPKLHYDWHWDFNTGNGDVGNQGPHEWDMMNWALGDPEQLPSSMRACGNRFGWSDAGNTPNIMACAGTTNDIPFCFEVMDLKNGRSAPYGRGVGLIIETERGRFVGGRGGGSFQDVDGKKEQFSRDETQKNKDGLHTHMQNFVEAVQARDNSNLRSECAVAANSSAMAHMANISYQLAKQSKTEELEVAFGHSVQQRDMLARLRESTMMYAMQNPDADVNQPWMLGPALSFNNSGRKFEGETADKANQKMTRDYREKFQLPSV